MILINLFFLVSSDRIDPDYGFDDGTKVRFQNPIPRQPRSRFRGLRFLAIFWVF